MLMPKSGRSFTRTQLMKPDEEGPQVQRLEIDKVKYGKEVSSFKVIANSKA